MGENGIVERMFDLYPEGAENYAETRSFLIKIDKSKRELRIDTIEGDSGCLCISKEALKDILRKME